MIKVLKPRFAIAANAKRDADEYAKSLKEVVAANSEVAKALDDFLSDNQRKMKEHRRFLQDVEVFRLQLLSDLDISAREISETFKWLTNAAGNATQDLMSGLSASMNNARAEAEGLTMVNEVRGACINQTEANRQFIQGLMTLKSSETS